MPDFPIDPELRIRARPRVVLRRTTEAVGFIRKMTLSRPGHGWRDLLQTFDAARDEWSAMEAVVHLELLLEAEGLLIEERTAHASPLGKIGFAPPRSKSRNAGAVPFGPCAEVDFAVAVCKGLVGFKRTVPLVSGLMCAFPSSPSVSQRKGR